MTRTLFSLNDETKIFDKSRQGKTKTEILPRYCIEILNTIEFIFSTFVFAQKYGTPRILKIVETNTEHQRRVLEEERKQQICINK